MQKRWLVCSWWVLLWLGLSIQVADASGGVGDLASRFKGHLLGLRVAQGPPRGSIDDRLASLDGEIAAVRAEVNRRFPIPAGAAVLMIAGGGLAVLSIGGLVTWLIAEVLAPAILCTVALGCGVNPSLWPVLLVSVGFVVGAGLFVWGLMWFLQRTRRPGYKRLGRRLKRLKLERRDLLRERKYGPATSMTPSSHKLALPPVSSPPMASFSF